MSQYNIDQVSIDEIAIVGASVTNDTGMSKLDNDYGFELEYRFYSGVNLSLKKVRVGLVCSIQAFDGKKERVEISGKFEITVTFNIQNLGELASQAEPGTVILDRELLAALTTICYSTSRGIIYTRCQGTILGKIILPVTSTDKLMAAGK